MRNQKTRKWTVFFIIKSVDHIRELITMVNEIRSLNFKDNISVVLCIYMAKEYLEALYSGRIDEVTKPGEKRTFTTMFFTIIPDVKGKEFRNRLELIDSYPEFDITNPEHLKIYFKYEILRKHEAKRYILFTWDHGRAYGMFSDGQALRAMADRKTMDSEKLSDLLIVQQNKGARILTMEELSDAIKWSFKKKKIDIIVMMNCLMQFIDTGYALRKSAKYLVATELLMDYSGYNYPFIFQVLIDNPKTSSKKLARHIVSSFITKVFPTAAMGEYQKKYTAIFSNDLSYYGLLARLVNSLSDYLIRQLPNAKSDILDARKNSLIDESLDLIDFYSFLSHLEEYGLFQDDTLLASLIISIKELIVFKSYVGAAFANGSTLSNYRPTGISIYFPTTINVNKESTNGFQQTSFFKRTKWKEFLIKCQET